MAAKGDWALASGTLLVGVLTRALWLGSFLALALTDGSVLPDPYSLDEGWQDDVGLLPDVGWPDIYNYVINTPSNFTKESLKAYKSLEAYNFFICGHVNDVYYHPINNTSDFCCIKSQVCKSILSLLHFYRCFSTCVFINKFTFVGKIL